MILITLNDTHDAKNLYNTIVGQLSPDTVQLSQGSRGFGGDIQSDIVILAATVVPIVVQKIAEILVNLMKTNAQRQVSINGVTIKGYSADDVARLLAGAPQRGRSREKRSE